MTANPITSRPDILAAELVSLMKEQRINAIIVTDNDQAVGALNMQDLLRAGVL
jgi:arabinose-5-phosphate isomerase